jgi:hypothetical protein
LIITNDLLEISVMISEGGRLVLIGFGGYALFAAAAAAAVAASVLYGVLVNFAPRPCSLSAGSSALSPYWPRCFPSPPEPYWSIGWPWRGWSSDWCAAPRGARQDFTPCRLIAHDLQISAARDAPDHIALMLQCGDDLWQRRNGL